VTDATSDPFVDAEWRVKEGWRLIEEAQKTRRFDAGRISELFELALTEFRSRKHTDLEVYRQALVGYALAQESLGRYDQALGAAEELIAAINRYIGSIRDPDEQSLVMGEQRMIIDVAVECAITLALQERRPNERKHAVTRAWQIVEIQKAQRTQAAYRRGGLDERTPLLALKEPSLNDVQVAMGTLSGGCVLMEFAWFAGERLLVFVIELRTIHLVVLDIRQEDYERWTLAAVGSGENTPDPDTLVFGIARMSDELLQPITIALSRSTDPAWSPPRYVGFIPTGSMNRWPLWTLRSSDSETPIGVKHVCFTLASAAMLPLVLERRPHSGSTLSLAPDRRLRFARAQAIAEANVYPLGRALVGREASLSHIQPPFRAVSFATHARLDVSRPQESSVELQAGHGLRPHSAAEFSRQFTDQQWDLTCLWACSTHSGVDTVDDWVGVSSVFLQRSRSIVATLWPVDDFAATVVAFLFAEQLRDGTPVADALAYAVTTLSSATKQTLADIGGRIASVQGSLWRKYWFLLRCRRELRRMTEYPFGDAVHWAPFFCAGWPGDLNTPPRRPKD